jgi:GNAT superfamily N-acetyltransferase
MEITLYSFDRLEGDNVICIGNFITKNMNLKFKHEEAGKCLVALKDGKTIVGVGYVSLGELKYLCTDEEYRGRGIGRRILRRLLDEYKSLTLNVPIYATFVNREIVYYSGPLYFYSKYFSVTQISLGKYVVSSTF